MPKFDIIGSMHLPHFWPTNTGHPACLVLASPIPLRFRFHQKAASPCKSGSQLILFSLTGLRLAKKSRATFATNQEWAQSHSFRIQRVSSAWRRLTVPLDNHSRLDSQTFEYRVSSLENKVSSFETKVLVGGLPDGRDLPCT